jgi:Mn-containing catalase
MPEFEEVYVNASQGGGDMRGPWNSDENFDYVSTLEEFSAVDGGATVELPGDQAETVAAMAARLSSDPARDPVTGIELGKAKGTMAKTTR